MPHYTSADDKTMLSRITFDFIAQLANRLEASGTEQRELARKLNVSPSEVSQVLNVTRVNLSLKTMMRYARALGMKVAVVAYDDRDPQNENGPVGAEIFNLAWEKIGRPRDIWSVSEAASANSRCLFTPSPDWRYGWVNSTFSGLTGTIGELPHFPRIEQPQLGTTAYA